MIKHRTVMVLGLLVLLAVQGCSAYHVEVRPLPVAGVEQFAGQPQFSLGTFNYRPADRGKVTATEIEARGGHERHFLSVPVGELLKEVTGRALEASGAKVTEHADLVLSGEVVELALEYGFASTGMSYLVIYRISDKKSNVRYVNDFAPKPLEGFHLFSRDVVAENAQRLMIEGYSLFLRDVSVKKLW